jgi:aminopeptidase
VDDNRLQRYADLIVRVGANVQPGQPVFINGALEHAELVRALVRSAYAAGAHSVDVQYIDAHVRKATIELAPDEVLTESTPWSLARLDAIIDGGALISLAGEAEPDLLADLDQERVGKARPVELSRRYFDAVNHRKVNWTIAAFPTEGQATAMFGEPDVERLWDAVVQAVRLDEADPVKAWREHVARLKRRTVTLDELGLDSVRFRGPGTDLTIGIHPEARWTGGALTTAGGIDHVPNLPTEEVFTLPDRGRTEGSVRSTRPLALHGTVVRDLELTFERGRVTEVRAAAGADAVRAQVDIDESASYLGEVALVDGESRVGRSGLTFFDTLFDENATCHIAYGTGVLFALPETPDATPDELRARGINFSGVHTDFMIGGPEVEVDGVTREGRVVPLLREDVWQLKE